MSFTQLMREHASLFNRFVQIIKCQYIYCPLTDLNADQYNNFHLVDPHALSQLHTEITYHFRDRERRPSCYIKGLLILYYPEENNKGKLVLYDVRYPYNHDQDYNRENHEIMVEIFNAIGNEMDYNITKDLKFHLRYIIDCTERSYVSQEINLTPILNSINDINSNMLKLNLRLGQIEANTSLSGYNNILKLLLPIIDKLNELDTKHTTTNVKDLKCVICLEEKNQLNEYSTINPCGHLVCNICIVKLNTCPTCRGPIKNKIKLYI